MKQIARIAGIFMLGTAANALADPGDSIATPDTVLTGYVNSPSVTIQVAAPSSALISRTTLKLNGADVTPARPPHGPPSITTPHPYPPPPPPPAPPLAT